MPSAHDLELLDGLSRDELIARARSLGAQRPEVMTRVELRDEIVRRSETDPVAQRRSRGWLGVARDLVASVVDSGLNLPGAAAAIRGAPRPDREWHGPSPVATVTLAEIYLAQGHRERALGVIDEVLRAEPDHAAAIALRRRLAGTGDAPRAPERVARVEEAAEAELDADGSAPSGAQAGVAEPSAPDEAPPVALVPPEPRPGVSACALAVGDSAMLARFELAAELEAAILRVATFVPTPAGPERSETDEPIDGAASVGAISLPAPAPGAVVRAAIGAGSGDEFRPVVVAWVYDARGPSHALSFAPPGPEPLRLRASLEATMQGGLG